VDAPGRSGAVRGEERTVSAWIFADVWEAAADLFPDGPALVHGERTFTWSEFDRTANGLGRFLLAGGVRHQDKVALYLYNCPEYLEAEYACFKCGLVPVNTNYRYADDELAYLWDNADAVAVIFHGSFTDRIERMRDRVPDVRHWLWVDDGTAPCPSWALAYDMAAGTTGEADSTGPVQAPWGRSPDDLFLLYTGGTTGMPKGVMWRQDDLFALLNAGGMRHFPEDLGTDGVRAALEAGGRGSTLLPACPLMHGTGGFTAMETLSEAGKVVTLPSRRFDPIELLDTIEREGVNVCVIVGDAFGKPILAALDADPGRWDLKSLVGMISSGVMWSEETKQGLLRHHPGMLLVDAFSSSEALGIGTSVSSSGGAAETARFTLGPQVRVVDDDGHDVEPGSGRAGVLALGGRIPLGYYKDEAKSAATFRVIDGARYSVPGDYAEVKADGSIHLLGRGSVSINTGGEKVYPEEVEEVIKAIDGVADAVVVGIPDERFGEEVAAVVQREAGLPPGTVTAESVIDHVKERLATYKAPRRVRFVDTIGRSPAGKVDYNRHRADTVTWRKEAETGG
jgi:fatty-acyl-CoA synthase